MRWVKNLWHVCTAVLSTSIDYAASFLDNLGSLSTIAGGAGLAFASVAEEQVNLAYYGSAYVPGELLVDITVPDLKIKINETIPFQHTWTKVGGLSYDLKNYITPKAIGFVSGFLVISGTFVRVAVANIKVKRQYSEDRRSLLIEEYVDNLAPPSRKEYKYAMAEKVCRSITQASLSYSIVGMLLSFSELKHFAERFTYPSTGQLVIEDSSYDGPVATELVPVSVDVEENITVNVPILDIKLIIQQAANAEAVANISYGGGLFFKARNRIQPMIVSPVVIALSSHAVGNFFERKLIRARDERLSEKQDRAYRVLV